MDRPEENQAVPKKGRSMLELNLEIFNQHHEEHEDMNIPGSGRGVSIS